MLCRVIVVCLVATYANLVCSNHLVAHIFVGSRHSLFISKSQQVEQIESQIGPKSSNEMDTLTVVKLNSQTVSSKQFVKRLQCR